MTKKLTIPALVLAFTGLTFGLIAPVQAVVPPSIEGGDIYRVRNLSKGGAYANSVSADKCEELQYRVQIHNPGPDEPLNGVTVRATLPGNSATQNVSTVTVSASNAVPQSVSDTATVNLSSAQGVSYVAGSAQLTDASGGVVSGLGDVTGGVSIGNVGISINQQRFVTFKAKVACPETPPPVQKNFTCTGLNATMINRTSYKLIATASVQNVVIQNYVFTVKNQSNATVDTKTVTTGGTSADYDFNQSTQGVYTVQVVINTDAGATNPDTCKKQITVAKEGDTPPPPTTPPVTPAGTTPTSTPGAPGASSPAELPATGPADVMAFASAVTVFSTVAYYIVSRRFSF